LEIIINKINKNMLSFRENIPIILAEVERLNPMRVLDIGAGMGKYGLLIREQYLSKKAEQGELEPIDDIVIDAVEDTKYLLTSRLAGIYNKICPVDIFNCEKELEKYDLILLIDVVEHWTKEKALEMIGRLLNHGPVLVSTPKRTGMYKEYFYGDSRHHITQWIPEDFNDFKYRIVESTLSHIIYIDGKN
jgi:2-polyprenyl-3-methyl-5-hydroxy-6-metoxy-1,4-benzoquinol methylase